MLASPCWPSVYERRMHAHVPAYAHALTRSRVIRVCCPLTRSYTQVMLLAALSHCGGGARIFYTLSIHANTISRAHDHVVPREARESGSANQQSEILQPSTAAACDRASALAFERSDLARAHRRHTNTHDILCSSSSSLRATRHAADADAHRDQYIFRSSPAHTRTQHTPNARARPKRNRNHARDFCVVVVVIARSCWSHKPTIEYTRHRCTSERERVQLPHRARARVQHKHRECAV